jgi:hypothetical protein
MKSRPASTVEEAHTHVEPEGVMMRHVHVLVAFAAVVLGLATEAGANCTPRRFYEVVITSAQPAVPARELTDAQGKPLGCWLPTPGSVNAALCAVADGAPHPFHVVVTNNCDKAITAKIKFTSAGPKAIRFRPSRTCKKAFQNVGFVDVIPPSDDLDVVCSTEPYGFDPNGVDRAGTYDVEIVRVQNSNVSNGLLDPEIILEKGGEGMVPAIALVRPVLAGLLALIVGIFLGRYFGRRTTRPA